MSKAVYAIVTALTLTAVTFAMYWFKKGEVTPSTSSLLPYFNRLYEMESHCDKYDLLLEKMGVEDQQKRVEITNSKDVFMITRDGNHQLWWNNEIKGSPDSWSIDLAKPTDWMTPDNKVLNIVFTLKGDTLTEVQTWRRDDGTKPKLTVTRKFEKDYLRIIITLDDLTCESKYKYVGDYDAYEASKAIIPHRIPEAKTLLPPEGEAITAKHLVTS